MIVTSELRGESYREHSWVDRHGWVWSWDEDYQRWSGRQQGAGAWSSAACTEDEVSNYSLFGGRGPFIKLATT